MNEPMDIFLGLGPGGKDKGRGNFGWSICKDDTGEFKQVCSGLGKYDEDVVDQVRSKLPSNARVQAAGIDAPMFWDATGKLYRKVDEIIKNAGISPVSLNGLYGSVLVQGITSGGVTSPAFPCSGNYRSIPHRVAQFAEASSG